MSTHTLTIEKNQKAKDVLDFLNKAQPKKGDKVKLVSKEHTIIAVAVILILGVALGYYFNKKKKTENAEKILDDFFTDFNTAEELEKHIEEEYGIIVEHQSEDTESQDWNRFALQNLNSAYAENEPDISHIQVKEPNPSYKPKA
jgi:superfamily I DNA and RNA helicase